MAAKTIELTRIGGNPSIEIIVGHAHWGNYRVDLYDTSGKNPELVAKGYSGDVIDDEEEIGPIEALQGRSLGWTVRAASTDPSKLDLYHITVLIRQDGKTAKNGVFMYSGELETVKTVHEYAKISVV